MSNSNTDETNYNYKLLATSLSDLARCTIEHAYECYTLCASQQGVSGTRPQDASVTTANNNNNTPITTTNDNKGNNNNNNNNNSDLSCNDLDVVLTQHNDQLACCPQCLVHSHNAGDFLVSGAWHNVLDCYSDNTYYSTGGGKLLSRRQSAGYIWNRCENSIDALFQNPSVLGLQESLDCIHSSFGFLLERTVHQNGDNNNYVGNQQHLRDGGTELIPTIAGVAMFCFFFAALVLRCAKTAVTRNKVHPTQDDDDVDGPEQLEDSHHRHGVGHVVRPAEP